MTSPQRERTIKDATIKISSPMKNIFKSSVQDQMLRSYIIIFLLVERSLKVRTKGKVTMREAFILEMISRLAPNKKNTPSVISKMLNISLPSLSVTIKSLLRKKYVTKVLSTQDNRFYYVELTTLGNTFVNNNQTFRNQMTHQTLGIFNLFSDLISEKIANAVEQYAKKEHDVLDETEKDLVSQNKGTKNG
jgi:DNA-binding MarR family transcriptional regulator